MSAATDDYGVLAERLGFQGSDRLCAVLKNLMTPEQAKITAALPGDAEEVATKTSLGVEKVRETLDDLFFMGVIFPKGDFKKREYYRFARSAGQFHDSTQASQKLDPDSEEDNKFFSLWHDFALNELYPVMGKAFGASTKPPWRIVPSYKALEGLPDVDPSEDFRELLKAQDLIAVVPCPCRYRTHAVGEPCAHMDELETWTCFQFNRGADYAITRGSGKQLSTEEALEVLDKIEERSLLHIWSNSTQSAGSRFSCQCCSDCCLTYVPLDMAGIPIGKVWEKSRYEASVDQEKCDGCQDCIERCHFDAIELVKPEKKAGGKKSKKLKAVIDAEKCWGCGVCVPGCKEVNAISFKAVRPLDFIPVGS